MIALDASALLALLYRETGWEHVEAAIPDSCISAVNLAEAIGRFVRDGHPAADVAQQLLAMPMEVVPFSSQHAVLAASLVLKTRPLGLSLGDRACLALALERGISCITADRTWALLDIGLAFAFIR